MPNSQVDIRGFVENLAAGSRSISVASQINTSAPSQVTQVTLANGNNIVVIPTNARGMIIKFPTGSVVAKFIKGVVGDNGIEVDPAGVSYISFKSTPPSQFVINAASADTGITEITFT